MSPRLRPQYTSPEVRVVAAAAALPRVREAFSADWARFNVVEVDEVTCDAGSARRGSGS